MINYTNAYDLLTPQAVRETTTHLVDWIKSGHGHFQIDETKLPDVVQLVNSITQKNYPQGKIPFHSRLNHLKVGDEKRLAPLNDIADPRLRLKSWVELMLVSVLVDAGAGKDWKFVEEGKTYSRSEGLAVASFYLFKELTNNTYSLSLKSLESVTDKDFTKAFQINESNPMTGIEGRVELLRKLASTIKSHLKNPTEDTRLGDMVDLWNHEFDLSKPLKADEFLSCLLKYLGPIWPSRLKLQGADLGDCWVHQEFSKKAQNSTLGFVVCFHKLSQWLCYSLLDVLIQNGIQVQKIDQLTGLPEYRNGGLLIDSGLVTLKSSAEYDQSHAPDSDLIIEWRALTIYYLDRIYREMKKSKPNLLMVEALEGGTWWAGRELAKKREGNTPPLKIQSDGTVF